MYRVIQLHYGILCSQPNLTKGTLKESQEDPFFTPGKTWQPICFKKI